MSMEREIARYEDDAQEAWEKMRPPLRTYAIRVRGFDSVHIEAATAKQAKYQAYKRWLDAGYGTRVTFGEFIKEHLEEVLHLGERGSP